MNFSITLDLENHRVAHEHAWYRAGIVTSHVQEYIEPRESAPTATTNNESIAEVSAQTYKLVHRTDFKAWIACGETEKGWAMSVMKTAPTLGKKRTRNVVRHTIYVSPVVVDNNEAKWRIEFKDQADFDDYMRTLNHYEKHPNANVPLGKSVESEFESDEEELPAKTTKVTKPRAKRTKVAAARAEQTVEEDEEESEHDETSESADPAPSAAVAKTTTKSPVSVKPKVKASSSKSSTAARAATAETTELVDIE